MDFAPQVAEFVQKFMQSSHTEMRQYDAEDEADLAKTSTLLYEYLNEADHRIPLQKPIEDNTEDKTYVTHSDSDYFPPTIQAYIAHEKKSVRLYTMLLAKRTINIRLIFFQHNKSNKNLKKYDELVRRMFMWISICLKQSANTTCVSTSLDVYVYLTPFCKSLPENPGETLKAENANTAYTYVCAPQGEIIIYREEEWFKVFLHETMHSFGLDLDTEDVAFLSRTLNKIFPIASDFNVAEAYVELWARIMNCAIQSYFSAKKREPKTFRAYFEFCLELERSYAAQQSQKILEHMGLSYKALFLANPAILQKFQESTHVFAYYILTAIILEDYVGFLRWCLQHNAQFIGFQRTKENREAFKTFLMDTLAAHREIVSTRKIKPFCPRDKNTRMSVVELI